MDKKLTDEEIETEFEDIIREQMSDKQFWKWVVSWFDVEEIIDHAREWDLEDKLELINDYKNKKYGNKR